MANAHVKRKKQLKRLERRKAGCEAARKAAGAKIPDTAYKMPGSFNK